MRISGDAGGRWRDHLGDRIHRWPRGQQRGPGRTARVLTASRRCVCSAADLGQLEEVVDGADNRPFAPDLIEPAQQELLKATSLLDLPKHRLDNLFPEAVAAPAASPLQPGGHRTHQRRLRQFPMSRRIRIAVARPPRSQLGGASPLLQGSQVRLVGKACITRGLARFAPEMSTDMIDERHEGARRPN